MLLSNLSMKIILTMVVTMMLGIQCEVTMVTMLVPSTISCNKIEAQSYIVTFAFVVVVWIMINEACSFCLSWSLIFIYYYFCVTGIKNGEGEYLKGRNRTKFLYSSHETTTNTNTHKHTLHQESYEKITNNTIKIKPFSAKLGLCFTSLGWLSVNRASKQQLMCICFRFICDRMERSW